MTADTLPLPDAHRQDGPGFFISVEGIDGAGKSSHLAALRDWLCERGQRVTLTREPGGTELAEALRALLLHHPMDGITQALLACAARRDHLRRVIVPALCRGDVVISDRFADATFAYQGGGEGVDWASLETLADMVQRVHGPFEGMAAGPSDAGDVQGEASGVFCEPALTLWFDLPACEAARRLQGVRLPDRFESRAPAFFEAVAAAYARRCAQAPGRFVRINAHQPPEAVWAEVRHAVQTALARRAAALSDAGAVCAESPSP